MKGYVIVLFALCCLLLANSCRNAAKVPEAETERKLPDVEKIDTPDCSQLVSMHAGIHGEWEFETRRNFVVKNPQHQYIGISINRSPRGLDYAGEQLSFRFLLASRPCLDDKGPVFITFADSSKIEAPNSSDNNCSGIFTAYIYSNPKGTTSSVDSADYKKICNKKIHSIDFKTHDGHQDYLLSDVQSTNLFHLINCLLKAK
jgi:hypothetical protein